jgi:hypothetical protein
MDKPLIMDYIFVIRGFLLYFFASGGRDESYEFPNYSKVNQQMKTGKNMTFTFQWNRDIAEKTD